MRKIILTVIACMIGAAILCGGVVFAAQMNAKYTLSFEEYTTKCSDIDQGRIKYPSFRTDEMDDFDPKELYYCYAEVDVACEDYAYYVAIKYGENADLDFTVENAGKLLTIKFTGTGYPENSEPEQLSRTYVFDLDGAGAEKLPKLINRAEFIGY